MSLFKKKSAGFKPALFQEEKNFIKNPGRGFYEIHTFVLGEGSDCGQPWDLENLRWCVREEHSLALVLLDVRTARDREMTEAELESVEALMEAFAALDVDIILRPVYDREGRGIENEPMLLSRIVRHMEQLSSVIMKYRRKILLIQGLMVGSWGEMHTSKFLQPQSIKNLAAVWLDSTDLYLAVRTPAQHRIIAEGKNVDRVALYNDGMFGSETDLGTYVDYEKDIAYLHQQCNHVPNGGEAVSGTGFPAAETVVDRMRQLRLCYLNSAHDRKVLDYFRSVSYRGECLYDYIEAHLGYRFVIRRAVCKRKAGELELEVQVENTGFGSLCQEAEVSLILEGTDKKQRELPIEADPRRWEPESKVTLTVKIPSQVNFTAYLCLRRCWDGKILQFANQGQREGLAVLGAWE